MLRVIRSSTPKTRLLKTLVEIAVFSILLLLPVATFGTHTPTSSLTLAQTSAKPVLRVGDTWHYHYSGPEKDSTEQILRNDTCSLSHCVVDQETNNAWNDTVWLSQDWNLSREHYVDQTTQFNYSYVYTPALQLYPFPLHVGESWWWNSTLTGWYTDQTGNHTQTATFSNLRKVINETTVTVPAGTFDTFLVAEYVQSGTVLHEYRWFSTDAKTSVKWESFDQFTHALFDSYNMTSYNLAAIPAPSPTPNPSPSPNPSPNTSPTASSPTILGLNPTLFYSIVGILLAAVVAAVTTTAFSKRKKSLSDNPINPLVGTPPATGQE